MMILLRVRPVFRAAFLTCFLVLAWLFAHQHFVAGETSAPADIRTLDWTFAPSDFHFDGEGYLSSVRRAPFSFTAAGVHFKRGETLMRVPTIELRLRADGEEWSPWYTIGEFEQEADGRLYGENLVAWRQAREVQVRVRVQGPLGEAIDDLIVIAIDGSAGPTAEQATLAARTRGEIQTSAVEGDPGVPQPIIISRQDWGANESWMTWPPYYAAVDKVIVHHTVSGGGTDPVAEVRAIYYYHAVTRDWGDIGYNFLVDRFGHVYEGRYGGLDVIGAHAAYWNTGSMGISVLGCYDNGACSSPRVPEETSLSAISDLTAWTSSRRLIDPRALEQFSNGYSTVTNYVLAGHRDYGSTVCPGGNLYAELPNLREMAWGRVPKYDVRFGWHSTPTAMDGGQQTTVYVDLYDYGRLVWSDAAGVHLGYRWIQAGHVVAESVDAARISPGAEVKFGEMTALVAQLTAPTVPGTFTLRWDLYRDGVGWFSDQQAPSGRSQPLDVTVQVAPVLSMNVQLNPTAVSAGATVHVDIIMQGAPGQAFETRTRVPPEAQYVIGSGYREVGEFHVESDEFVWAGALSGSKAQAGFDMLVSSELTASVALSITTTVNSAGYSPPDVTRWFIVNGHHVHLPFVDQAWTD